MKIKTVQFLRTPMFIGILIASFATLYVLGTKGGYTMNSLYKKAQKATQAPYHTNAIQVALLLDTSNSMDGLIEQAKSQLWKIVGELSRVQKDGQTPDIQISVYEFGNDYISAAEGHIRQIAPFTTDMDLISEKLFALKTNGGKEYCGAVIDRALEELRWSSSDNLKLIYIAGNESFEQGTVPYVESCQKAKKQSVLVNTIFCGKKGEGVELLWKDGATTALGEYMSINHNKAAVYIESPFDDRISELNQQLNSTYIPFGKEGTAGIQNMTLQDSNASSYSKVNAVDRAVFKCKSNYSNEKWDLIDACKKDKSILKNTSKLPSQFKGKSEAEIEAKIAKITAKRDAIQAQIEALDKERRTFVAAKEAESSDKEAATLGKSLLTSVKAQAAQKGYKMKE